MKEIFIFLGLFFCSCVFGQELDTINTGSSPGAGDGEVLYSAFTKVNRAILKLNDTIAADSVIFNYHSGSLTDGTPSEAEINAILGAPSVFSAGWTARIKDSDGTGLVYYLVTDGTTWYWIISTAAL